MHNGNQSWVNKSNVCAVERCERNLYTCINNEELNNEQQTFLNTHNVNKHETGHTTHRFPEFAANFWLEELKEEYNRLFWLNKTSNQVSHNAHD